MATVGGTHDVRIGANYYIVKPGSYMKRAAPLFGSRFTSGDPDYNNLNFWQHWAQTCWVGGFGAETWSDDAMFDEGVGVDATQHEVMTLSRDLGPSTRGTWVLDNALSGPKIFRVFNNTLYCLVTNTNPGLLYRYNDGSPGTWSLIKTFTGENVNWLEEFNGYLVFGDSGTTMNRMTTGEVFDTIAKPAGRTEVIYTLKTYRSHLYVGLGRFIYRLKTDWTWDGGTHFFEAPGINYLNHSDIHLGFLYMSSRNGHVLRTDGNNTFDLWQFEPHIAIWGIRSFDGRLFILTGEEIEGTDSTQAVLYQFSGAAVTELKRWGKVGYDTTGGKLRAYERKLFFGGGNLLGMGEKDGFGIAAYDPVEDAFHMFASNQDGVTYAPGTEGVQNVVDDVCYFKGRMFAVTRRHGAFVTPWTYKDVTRYQATYDTTAAGAVPGSQNGGWYVSSDFDAGTPGLLKLWNAMTVHVDLPTSACSVYVESSVDGGLTWSAVGTVTKTGAATRYSTTFVLGGGTPVRATRFKYRVTLRTSDSTRSPQLRGVIVRYLPIPEPQWVWNFTLVISDRQQLHDGTIEERDLDALIADLQTKFRDQNLVEFQDIDGTIWAGASQPGVLMHDFQADVPYIGPSPDGYREAEVRIQLMEAVETY